MNEEFNFEVEPFRFQPEYENTALGEFDTELADQEWEEELGRSRRLPVRSAQYRQSTLRSRRPPVRPPRPPIPPYWRPRRPGWPPVIVYEPASTSLASDQASSEYVRWVQSTLNHIMGLRLPVDGVMRVDTRSALRSFQKQQGLPPDGIVGPDTERALIEAGASQPSKDEGQELFEYGYYEEIPLGEADYEYEYEMEEEVNRQSPAYAMWVQQSLNKILGLRLAVDGITGAQTRSAIRSFQQRNGLLIDGIVGPQTEGALIRAGAGNPPGAAPSLYIPGGSPVPSAGRKELSGASWVSRFPTSRSTGDLEPTFANNVNRFISALKAAGASVSIAATYRPQERAYLMHWAWKIANGEVSAQNVPPMSGVEINWWHGNDADSRRAAQEMVNAYSIVAQPSLTSRHIERKAIDMSISWSGNLQIKKANGQSVLITSSPKDGTNRSLIEVGRSYNVVHYQPPEGDPPHWSVDGR